MIQQHQATDKNKQNTGSHIRLKIYQALKTKQKEEFDVMTYRLRPGGGGGQLYSPMESLPQDWHHSGEGVTTPCD